ALAASRYDDVLRMDGVPARVRAQALEGLGDITLARAQAAARAASDGAAGARQVAAGASMAADTLFRAAERYYEAAIAEGERDPAHMPPEAGRRLWGLGDALEGRGDYRGAVETHNRALEIMLRTYGPVHQDVGFAQLQLGTSQ